MTRLLAGSCLLVALFGCDDGRTTPDGSTEPGPPLSTETQTERTRGPGEEFYWPKARDLDADLLACSRMAQEDLPKDAGALRTLRARRLCMENLGWVKAGKEPALRPEQQSARSLMQDRPGPPELRDMIVNDPRVRKFAFHWALNPRGLYFNTWLGVTTVQNPLDAWVTQEIMQEVKPDFVVETGTLHGGSAALWGTVLEQINPAARVITVDIKDQVTAAKELPVWKEKVDFLLGDSTDPAIVADIKKRVGNGRTMVILDSLHTKDHVLNELKLYSPIVSVGSYLVVQSTGIGVPSRFQGGAAEAVAEFMRAADNFEIDIERERLVMTHNAHGYLKRIR